MQPRSCLRELLWYKSKNAPDGMQQFRMIQKSGNKLKIRGKQSINTVQRRKKKQNKTKQHSPCSYLSGTAVPRIAYSETRKLRKQQGRAESWPSEKKTTQQNNPKEMEREHGQQLSCILDIRASQPKTYQPVFIFKSSADTWYSHKKQLTLPLLLGGKRSPG